MNKKKAIAIISKSVNIVLYQNVNGSSWISNGGVFYNLGDFPYCETEEQFVNVIGLTDKQRKNCIISLKEGHDFPIVQEDLDATGALIPIKFSILDQDMKRGFFVNDTNNKAIMVNAAYLKPINDDEAMYFEYMHNNRKNKIIEVSYGFIKVAYILPIRYGKDMVSKYLEVITALKEDREVSDNVQL